MSSPSGDLVVVIEDDPRLSAALEVLIRHWGFRCVVARTPREGLEACGTGIRDVCAIIIDIELDALTRARRGASMFAEAAGRVVPTLLTTTTEASGLNQSETLFILAKPFDPELVRQWLASESSVTAAGPMRMRG